MQKINFIGDAREFFSKNKVRLKALAASMIIIGTLSGCGNNNESSSMEDYITDSLVITTTDGEKQIVKKIIGWNCSDASNKNHYHYRDAVTGSYYSDSLECMNYQKNKVEYAYPTYIEVQTIETLGDYLTSEEIAKLLKNEFTNEDYVNLILRIKSLPNEEVKTK